MQWFRFYSEAIRDTKLRRIARDVGQPLPYVIGVWATVLSIASESPERGVLLVSKNIPATIDDISDAAGCNVSETFQKLLVTGLVTSHVTEGETVYSVASWEKRQYDTGRSLRRERGLKRRALERLSAEELRRSLRRERGLKRRHRRLLSKFHMSLPSQGAWIETRWLMPRTCSAGCRSLRRERGLKRGDGLRPRGGNESLPSQGAWIETSTDARSNSLAGVAPFAGSVD